jgi:SAM-dependent methyltransferase
VNSEPSRPSWQLPPGVSKGTWDYVTQAHIAVQYDSFHEGHPLLALDQRLVLQIADDLASQAAPETPLALDLGCGTGRTLLPLIARGWKGIGVDLSSAMLATAAAKVTQQFGNDASALVLVHSNMAQLEFLKDRCLHLATCLYSSIGMVQGRSHRRHVFRQVARVLRDDGRFIVHVHNRGIWARDPGGLRRMLQDRLRSLSDPIWEYGDRVYAYRGLPSMYLHIYSERELRSDLRHAGLRIERILPLNITSSGYLPHAWWLRSLRAGGFIAIASPALPRN